MLFIFTTVKYSFKNDEMKIRLIILAIAFVLFISCQFTPQKSNFKKGEYGYDLEFLQKYLKPIELVNDKSRLIVMPQYQGRVMTSSSNGLKGYSYGWVNHDLIASGKVLEHFNPYGGEERLWLGPEGGQFSIFFPKDSSFTNQGWFVPKAFDTEPFDVQSKDSVSVTLVKDCEVKNQSGTAFNIKVTRKITLLSDSKIRDLLGTEIGKSVHAVAYQSENQLKNVGNNEWTKQSGALSIWMLSMLNASPDVTVILPYKKGDLGKIVKDDYFVKVPENRLKITENAVLFLADGKFRSKIGISPERTIPRIGSYDARNNKLTILEFLFSEKDTAFVNNALEIQKEPFSGDVINAYNDGPKEGGPGMGIYYEIETSSPAAFLKPGETISHDQHIYHFEGSEEDLDRLAKTLLNVSLTEVKSAFKLQ
jgi:hypothetical protein